jgi:hypothetical protein
MTILKTKADVDTLNQLQQRKAALKAQIAVEEAEIKEVWHEVRHDLQPGEILGQAVKSALGFHNTPETPADQVAFGFASRLSGPLRLVADTLIRDPKVALLLKIVTPLSVAYLPRLARKVQELVPEKREVYGLLQRSVARLRKRLKNKEVPDDDLFI